MTPYSFPEELISSMKNAKSVVVLTGAGVSAESNIPTFRDAMTGLWAQYDPRQLATPTAFRNNPKLVWDWYQWRRELVANATPNPGHDAITKLEKLCKNFTLITQNVDSLHQRAGSTNILELHGNLNKTKCFDEDIVIDSWEDDGSVPPRCPRCQGLLRPGVVWFEEALDHHVMEQAAHAAYHCDIFFSVGTSAQVYPAAQYVLMAKSKNALTVEINPNPTPQSKVLDFALQGPSGEVLPALIDAVWPDHAS